MEPDKELLSINLILQKLEALELSHLDLERKIDEIHKNTKHMEEHIDFVENVYEKIKIPFHYLMNKVNLLSFSYFKKTEVEQNEKYKLENYEDNEDNENNEYNEDNEDNKKNNNSNNTNLNDDDFPNVD